MQFHRHTGRCPVRGRRVPLLRLADGVRVSVQRPVQRRREAWQTIRDALPDTVVADLRADNAYWAQFRGVVSKVSDTVYDGFLKSNGDTDGSKSYGVVTDLLVAYFG